MFIIFFRSICYLKHFQKPTECTATSATHKNVFIPYMTFDICKLSYLYGHDRLVYNFLLILALGLGISTAASASDEYDQKRKLALERPNDPVAAYEFAQVADRNGDHEAAISTLEKMLKNNPGLSSIKLDLGLLYKKTGNQILAKKYLREAINAPDIPSDVKQRAESELAEIQGIGKIITHTPSPPSLNGRVSIAALYDNNANAGPSDRSIRVNGADATLNEEALESEDSSLELTGDFQYRHKFSNHQYNQFEVDLLSYNRFYDEFSGLDINLLELAVGPRFNVTESTTPTTSLKPYLVANAINLGRDNYKNGIGIGLSGRKILSANTRAEFDFKAEKQDYSNSTERPKASERTGTYSQIRGKLTRSIDESSQVSGQLGAARRDSEKAYESLNEISMGVDYQRQYSSSILNRPGRASLSVELRNIKYDEQDVGFDEARKENRATIRIGNSIDVKRNLSLDTSLSYTKNQSDITLYDYDNLGASVGVSLGF